MMNDPVATDDTIVYVSRFLPASPEKVFQAWTDAARLNEWFGPPGYKANAVTMDVRTGGEYEIVMQPPASDGEPSTPNTITGRYREVSPPRLLVFTWAWKDASGTPMDGVESLVTIEFSEAPGGTDVRITHERLPAPELREAHRAGWTATLERLEALLP